MRKSRKAQTIITCELVEGGFLFSTGTHQFIQDERRIVTCAADAITVFVSLIHGQKLKDIKFGKEKVS